MKRFLIELAALLLLLAPATLGEGLPDGLIVEENRLSGTVKTHFGEDGTDGDILVDCPLPEAAYPPEILTLSKGYVSKKQMQAALRAAGQSGQGQFVNPRGSAFYSGDWHADASADMTPEDTAAQAVSIGLAYFDALGVEVERTPHTVSRPYDYDAYIERHEAVYAHRFSDPTAFMDSAHAMWKRRMKSEAAQSGYTRVDFRLTVDGLRLWETSSYPAHYADEPDAWICTPVGAHVIVSDSGVLVEASCDLLEIIARRPLESDAVYADWLGASEGRRASLLPAGDWQDALRLALSDPSFSLSCGAEEAPFQSASMAVPVTAYGYRTVVTSIHPVLSAISAEDWAPFFTIKTTEEYADGWRMP